MISWPARSSRLSLSAIERARAISAAVGTHPFGVGFDFDSCVARGPDAWGALSPRSMPNTHPAAPNRTNTPRVAAAIRRPLSPSPRAMSRRHYLGHGHARIDREVEGGRPDSLTYDLGPERRDHRAVVGAQVGAGHAKLDAGFRRTLLRELPQPAVRRDAAADDQRPHVMVEARRHGLAGQYVAHSVLERGGDVSDDEHTPHALLRMHVPGNGTLENG